MKCIIVDDEPLARDGLQLLLNEIPDLEVVGKFSNGHLAMAFIKRTEVDLVFLDIQMPKLNGLDFASQLPKNTLVIFITAYSQYALTSYDLDAVDYLVKPLEKERLNKAIGKAFLYKKMLSAETHKNTIEGSDKDFLFIKANRRHYKVHFDDIQFIEGLKDYVVIYAKEQKLITAMNLKTIHQKIQGNVFCRISKSYIINVNHVDSFDGRSLSIGQIEIPIGEAYRKDFYTIYLDKS